MKRVLIVTYYFPPSPAVGALRAGGLARHLPGFGWEPVVLTVEQPDRAAAELKLIETPYRDVFGTAKKLLGVDAGQNILTQLALIKKRLHISSERSMLDRLATLLGEVVAYPDPQKGWRRHAIKAGSDFLGKEPVDAIISSSSPYTVHIVARTLKQRHRMPWVADLRDLWTQNHYYPYSRLRRRVERQLELRTLSAADALVTVSGPLTLKLEELHKGRSAHTITNGFDPGVVNSPASKLTEKFTITYTGNLYPGKQSPEPMFAALSELIAEGAIDRSLVEVRFYGAEAGWIDRQAEQYGLKALLGQFGIISRQEALEKQRESQVLLLLKWNDPEEKGTYSAKAFEYLAARRPILAVGGYQDVVTDLLVETGAGDDALTKEDVKRALNKAMAEYQTTGKVAYRGKQDTVDRYSQREMARRFAEVLGRVSS